MQTLKARASTSRNSAPTRRSTTCPPSPNGRRAWGFKALQVPAWDQRFFDVELAASSQDYCDEITGMLAGRPGHQRTDHAHLRPAAGRASAYDAMFDTFAPAPVRGNPAAREWARRNLLLAARASRRLGLTEMGTFSGSFAWPYLFPFPQRPED